MAADQLAGIGLAVEVEAHHWLADAVREVKHRRGFGRCRFALQRHGHRMGRPGEHGLQGFDEWLVKTKPGKTCRLRDESVILRHGGRGSGQRGFQQPLPVTLMAEQGQDFLFTLRHLRPVRGQQGHRALLAGSFAQGIPCHHIHSPGAGLLQQRRLGSRPRDDALRRLQRTHHAVAARVQELAGLFHLTLVKATQADGG